MRTTFIISVFLLFQAFSLKAQTENFTPEYLGVLYENQNMHKQAASQVNQNAYINQNAVNIRQIGNFNTADITLKSSNYAIDVSQYGNNNSVDVYRNDLQTRQNIYQQGNNNAIKDFSFYSNQRANMNFTQLGNNLKVNNYGTNSISENMSIFQTGSAKEIIIINR